MTEPVFVDTNVLVCARDASEPVRQAAAFIWLDRLRRSRMGRTSFRVLHEYHVTVTTRAPAGFAPNGGEGGVEALLSWRPMVLDSPVLRGAWALEDRHSLSWWDSLIVSAAQAGGCRYLLSEDFSDGATFAGLEVVDPFVRDPAALGLEPPTGWNA